MIFVQVIKWCSILSALLPLIVGWQSRKHLLWYYPLIALLTDLTVHIAKNILHMPYTWLQNCYILLEFVLLFLVYRPLLLQKNGLFYGLLSVGFIVSFVDTLNDNENAFNVAGASYCSINYIILGIAGLYDIMQKQKIFFLERNWFFWLNTGLIFYASGNFLIFLFTDYLHSYNNLILHNFWVVFQLLNIVKNIFLSFSLYFMQSGDEQPE